MTREAKNIAIGVFVALLAFRLFEIVLRMLEDSMELPVLLVIIAVVALAIFATTKRGKVLRR